MAFRSRRRKASVAWLPLLGQGGNSDEAFIGSTLTVTSGGTISTTVHSLIPDYPAEAVRAAGQIPTLSDFEGSGYRLRRIVGKFNVGLDNTIGTDQNPRPECCLVAAGFIVLRVDEFNGAPLAAATPIQYSPLGLDNARDPWIWRRTWLLGSDLAAGGIVYTAAGLFPSTNAEYGSAMDGPHIDAKTARRVSAEERLFLVVSTQYPGIGLAPTVNGIVRYVSEFRVLATPIKVMGNRRNASR